MKNNYPINYPSAKPFADGIFTPRDASAESGQQQRTNETKNKTTTNKYLDQKVCQSACQVNLQSLPIHRFDMFHILR